MRRADDSCTLAKGTNYYGILFYSHSRAAIMVTSCPLCVRHMLYLSCGGAEPPSTHPSRDAPSRYRVTPTLSYAVEFIVCTAADYRCLTCRAGDLKRQRRSQHCIRLACRKARGMLGSLGSARVSLCGRGHETCASQQEGGVETRLNILVSNIDTLKH